MIDRFVGLCVFAVFAPSLALLSLLVGVVCDGPVFEWRLRIEDGELYRTRRFRTENCRLGRFLKRYGLDDMPAILDIAAGRARLYAAPPASAHASLQNRIAIRAPKPKKAIHPSAANPSQANTIVE
jgi:hypothetical protein